MSLQITAPSLLRGNDSFITTLKRKDNISRATFIGDKVSVYRNLHNGLFTIKQRGGTLSGKVSGYAAAILLKNPFFAISDAGRERVLKMKQKMVHAYVRGEFVDAFNEEIDTKLAHYRCATYNPYHGNKFFDKNTMEDIDSNDLGEFVLIQGTGIILL
jgi:hypothetical protein